MKKKKAFVASAFAIGAMLTGSVMANGSGGLDSEEDIPRLEEKLTPFVQAICDFDLETYNSFRNFDLKFAERKLMPASNDCKERGGVERVKVEMIPNSVVIYPITGAATTDTTVYFKDGSTEVMYLTLRWERPESPERLLVENEAAWKPSD